MKVQVFYTTQLKSALGFGTEHVDVEPPCTIAQLLGHLVSRHGSTFEEFVLDDHGKPLPSIVLCVGDQQVDGDESVTLQDGDEVTILSAISGG